MEGCRGNNRAGVGGLVIWPTRTKTEPKATNHSYNHRSTLLLLDYFKTTAATANMVLLKLQLSSGLIQLILLLLLLKATFMLHIREGYGRSLLSVFCVHFVRIAASFLKANIWSNRAAGRWCVCVCGRSVRDWSDSEQHSLVVVFS